MPWEKIRDVNRLFAEVKAGMKKCKELRKIPISVGIDTWAVDFVLLDKEDERIRRAVAYRDGCTQKMDKKVYEIIPEKELYEKVGIRKQIQLQKAGLHHKVNYKRTKESVYWPAKRECEMSLHMIMDQIIMTECGYCGRGYFILNRVKK